MLPAGICSSVIRQEEVPLGTDNSSCCLDAAQVAASVCTRQRTPVNERGPTQLPKSLVSFSYLVVRQSGGIYTTEIGRCYIQVPVATSDSTRW